MSVEIYLSDLTEEKQQEVLEASNTDADDNWDLSPIAILDFDDA